jgi:hypothetical protein
MPHAEIDIAWDCPIQEALDLFSKHNLAIKTFQAHGPAGGNPCLTLAGTRENLLALLTEHFTNCGHPTAPNDPWLLSHITD